VNFQRKFIILLGIISIFIILNSGCIFVTPNYDNYIVSYIRVSPSSSAIQVDTSKQFSIKAYDLEDNLIPVDPSKVSWDWGPKCPMCGKKAEVNPENGSTKTTFLPHSTGTFKVYVYYKDKTDYSPVNVFQ
jgi:hypothetical protein